MKKSSSNHFFSLQKKSFIIQKSFFQIKKRVFLLLLFCFFSLSTSAQVSNSNNSVNQVTSAESYLTHLKNSGQNSSSIQLEHLLNDLQSAVYVYSGQAKTYGDKPISMFTDINSLGDIGTSSFLKDDIEIITIAINTLSDLNKTIDLSFFSQFPKLKYIYILSNVQASENDINKLIKKNTTQYVVIYRISIGG